MFPIAYGFTAGNIGYTDHACLESLFVKKGKLFSVEEFISWLGQFKSLNSRHNRNYSDNREV